MDRESVGYALWAWRKERTWIQRLVRSRTGPPAVAAFAVIAVLISFIPVPLTALAPAEITPMKPAPITSPLDGVVREIAVKPNQTVKAGELVAVLDDTAIRNRLVVAERALDIARADLQRATYKSFSDDASRMELQVLDARVREKAAEAVYLSELLGKLKLTAPHDGIAVFADPEEWRGKPVQVGERVMVIADPSFVDVTIYVAPEDVIDLEVGAEVTVYLHVSPLSSLDARITRASYEALPAPDGKLAYWVRAELLPGHELPRIGLRGTAKVRAGQVSLAFYLLRKPLAFLRRTLGV